MYFHTPPGTAAPSACPQTWPPGCRPPACPCPQTAPDPAGFLPCPCPQFRFQPRPRRPGCPGIPLPSPVHPRTPLPSLPPQRAYASHPLRPPPAASAPLLPALPVRWPRRSAARKSVPPPPGPCPRPRPPPSALCARFWPLSCPRWWKRPHPGNRTVRPPACPAVSPPQTPCPFPPWPASRSCRRQSSV